MEKETLQRETFSEKCEDEGRQFVDVWGNFAHQFTNFAQRFRFVHLGQGNHLGWLTDGSNEPV